MASSFSQQWIAYTDGASCGNPGLSGDGAVLTSPSGDEFPLKKFLGEKTNNQAEYEALLLALEEAKRQGAAALLVRADSELMVRQMNGQYRVKNENILPLYKRAKELASQFSSICFEHVRREQNTAADKLANQAIDERVR